MGFKNKKVILGYLLTGLLVSISALHFFTSTHKVIYHDFFDRLYYIPIILSSFFFGLRGGIIVSFASGSFFYLHLKLQWDMYSNAQIMGRYLEIIMYVGMGVITGILSDMEKKRRRQTEEAYEKINQSFEKAKEAARLAAIGRVSAGVAHEIRNPLGGIKGAMEIISAKFTPNDSEYPFVEIIEKEISRINGIVEDFLYFAKPRTPDLAPANLNNLIQSLLQLNQKNLEKKNISLQYDPPANLPIIFVDANQIKQVFLNLILNSIDSMEENGILEINSGVSGDMLEITISDTGSGIAEIKENELFEPFFTTKPLGTGMGLAISKQIIEFHEGEIWLKNRSDGKRGAVAKVRLPLQNGDEEVVG